MYSSAHTDSAVDWARRADELLRAVEDVAPAGGRPFSEFATEADSETAAVALDERVSALIDAGEVAWSELRVDYLAGSSPSARQAEGGSAADARFRATSLLVGTLAVADAVASADLAPIDAFYAERAATDQVSAFGSARLVVAQAAAMVSVPASLGEALEKLEVAGATESWEIVRGSIGTLAGGALVAGLEGVLHGAAADAFAAIKKQLSSWWDALKRAVVRLVEWVVDKAKTLLPPAAAAALTQLVDAIQAKVEVGVGNIATDAYGQILGRTVTESAWQDAAAAGRDLTTAEARLAAVVSAHIGRIGWVTKGREVVERFEKLAAALIATLPAEVKLVLAAVVAAVLGFVAVQVWDGFNDVEALVD